MTLQLPKGSAVQINKLDLNSSWIISIIPFLVEKSRIKMKILKFNKVNSSLIFHAFFCLDYPIHFQFSNNGLFIMDNLLEFPYIYLNPFWSHLVDVIEIIKKVFKPFLDLFNFFNQKTSLILLHPACRQG